MTRTVAPHTVDDLGELDPAWAGLRPTHVEVDGARVRVITAGPADAPPVVLVHGLSGAATNWVELAPLLAEDHRVLAVELAGHGETPAPRPDAAAPWPSSALLAATLDELGAEDATVVGNSFGGLVSTLLASRRPDLVGRMVLLAPALPQTGLPRVSPRALLRFAPFVLPGGGARAIRRRRATTTPAEEYRATVSLVWAHPERAPERLVRLGVASVERARELPWRLTDVVTATEGLLRATATPGGRARVLAAVDAVAAPTVVVRGERDELVSSGVTDLLAERRPDWEQVHLADVGHVPMLEVPDVVADLVRGVGR